MRATMLEHGRSIGIEFSNETDARAFFDWLDKQFPNDATAPLAERLRELKIVRRRQK